MVLIFHVDLQNRAYEIKTFKWARNKVHREKVNFLILVYTILLQNNKKPACATSRRRLKDNMKIPFKIKLYGCEIKRAKLKINLSLYRPGQALRAPGDWGSQNF